MKRLVLVRYIWKADAIDEDWCLERWVWRIWQSEPPVWKDPLVDGPKPSITMKMPEARLIWQAIYEQLPVRREL